MTPLSSRDALQRLLPLLAKLQITRIGDLTGLDRIGIPVAQAVRPSGLANSVTQGKGVDLAAAAVSAIMEAAEQFFAERIDAMEPVAASAIGLGIEPGQFRHHLLGAAPHGWESQTVGWLRAEDLLGGPDGWLPFEMVHTAYVDPPIATDGVFEASTSGLACGFDAQHAKLHGLLECIERDAIARAQATHGFFHRYRIDENALKAGELAALLERVEGAGLVAAFFAAEAAGAVPVVWCQIMEDGGHAPLMPLPAEGFAAALDFGSAMRAALLEAVQSRLAAISGARDDITRAAFPSRFDWQAIGIHRRFLREGARMLREEELCSREISGPGSPLDLVLERLERAGISAVLHVPLDNSPCPGIAASRIAVPQLLPLREA